jgi:hypothetical protein
MIPETHTLSHDVGSAGEATVDTSDAQVMGALARSLSGPKDGRELITIEPGLTTFVVLDQREV